jgi:hypothetical protein
LEGEEGGAHNTIFVVFGFRVQVHHRIGKKTPYFAYKLLVERKSWILQFEIQNQKIGK